MKRLKVIAASEISPFGRTACIAATLATGVGFTSSAVSAATVLFDFGNNNSYRGASVVNPDQNGNRWNSLQTGVFYQDLIDTTGTATTIDFGFSTPVGTDSYNGPAGPTTNQPLTQAEIDAADIDAAALGIMGVKAAAVDYVNGFDVQFEIQQLDPTKTYDLTFFGSHKFSTSDSTTYSIYTDNTYTTVVASGTLLVQTPGSPWLHNRDTVLTLSNIAPQTSNILYVQFTGTAGGFGYLNDLAISEVAAASTWNVNAGGSWHTASNWSGGVPNGVDAEARFYGAITTPHSVNADSPAVAGTLRFNNANSYVIGGASTLTLQVSTGSALVDVQAGTHEINLPLTIASDTTLSVASGATLKISDPVTINAGKTLAPSGAGTVSYESTVTVLSGGGITFGSSSHLAGLDLGSTATATVSQSGGVRSIKTDSLTIASTGKIDLKDNKLIVAGGDVGTWDGSAYTGITGLIQSGRNPETGTWDGNGITTSMTDATTGVLTTLAVSTGAEIRGLGPTDTDLFGGQTINGDSVLVMYTWGGDADMNGELNGDDYFWIDSNILANQAGADNASFHNGDFNYDGVINGDDYFILDSNILFAQGSAPFPTGAGASGIAAVPEPAAISGIALAASALLGRKRRRARLS